MAAQGCPPREATASKRGVPTSTCAKLALWERPAATAATDALPVQVGWHTVGDGNECPSCGARRWRTE